MHRFQLLLSWVLTTAMAIHTPAWASLLSEGKLDEADELVRSTYLEDLAHRFNSGMTIREALREVELFYPRKEDQEYLQGIIKKANPSWLALKSRQAVLKDKDLEVTISNGDRIYFKMDSLGGVKINNRAFQFDLNKPLKETHKQLTPLFEQTLADYQPSILDFVIPKANATALPLLALYAVAVGLTALVGYYYLREKNLKTAEFAVDLTKRACQNRQRYVPVEKSVVTVGLKYLEEKKVFTLESQKQIPNCYDWARNITKNDQDPRFNRLVNVCKEGRDLLECVNTYKIESAKLQPANKLPAGWLDPQPISSIKKAAPTGTPATN